MHRTGNFRVPQQNASVHAVPEFIWGMSADYNSDGMMIFKRIFGHERDAAGKTLDSLVFGCILVSAAIGIYAGWKAFFIVLAISAIVIFGVPYVFYLIRSR